MNQIELVNMATGRNNRDVLLMLDDNKVLKEIVFSWHSNKIKNASDFSIEEIDDFACNSSIIFEGD